VTTPAAALAAFLAATTLHLGFQLTVTVLVYPALARATEWERAHAAHTRAITPLVGMVYGALGVTGAWAVAEGGTDPWLLAAVAAVGVSVLVTALVAAPAHGRLSSAREEALLRRLLAVDRVRSAGALLGALAAAVAVAGSAW
jgi:hypothetical protein